eukprot:scaffold26917_cov17-Tisochrysis_lutea.AAC.1
MKLHVWRLPYGHFYLQTNSNLAKSRVDDCPTPGTVFMELESHQHCLDRKCFTLKIAAASRHEAGWMAISRLVLALIRADWSVRKEALTFRHSHAHTHRSSQPNAHPAGHVTSPTRRAFYPAHPYATSQGSGTQQSIQHVRPSSSADEQHRQALHAALYGPRTTASNGSNLLGNPAMGLFKAYDGPVPSKAALSEGTPMQEVKEHEVINDEF